MRGTEIEAVKKKPAAVYLKQIKHDPLVAQDSSVVPPLDGAAVMLTALNRFLTCTGRWGQIDDKRFVFTLVRASQNVRTYVAADVQIKSHNLTLTLRFCWKHVDWKYDRKRNVNPARRSFNVWKHAPL